MYVIEWGNQDERYFQHGVDRGVFYDRDNDNGKAWNGITGVTESGNGSSTVYYIDGQIYLADVDATDFSGSLTAFDYPPEFAGCVGMPMIADGLFMDNQKPTRFGFCYRSLIGSGIAGDQFGYMIHLWYNCMATIGNKARKTLNANTTPMEFNFDLVAKPVKIPGFRPSAHLVLDTRTLSPEQLEGIERLLYGEIGDDYVISPRLPDPIDLFEMIAYGDAISVIHYVDDALIAISGNSGNVHMTDPDSYVVNNVNAVDNGDGTYDISDGGLTTVTEE